jgi:SAM-dependent methyltransferase
MSYVFPHNEDFPHSDFAEKRKWVLDYIKSGTVGAEFGVFRGHFSEIILREKSPSKLYLVDPWTKFGERYNWNGGGHEPNNPYTNFNKLTTAEAKADAAHRVSSWKDSVELIEDFEEGFCRNFTDKLDFVYLDSSHWYTPTLRTLILIDRILKEDGVILGDDWYSEAGHYSGVCRAVNDFVRHFNYEIIVAGQDTQFVLRRTPVYTHPLHPKTTPSILSIMSDLNR